MRQLRDGGPFLEFIAIVLLLAGAGVAMVLLAGRPDSQDVVSFFQQAAQTLLGAVIALAYAAQRKASGDDKSEPEKEA